MNLASLGSPQPLSLFDNIFKAGARGAVPTRTLGESRQPTSYGGYSETREKSPRLQGTARYVTYSEMLANTSIVATGTRYFLNILANAHWSVEPAMDADGKPLPGAQEIADLVEDIMGDMTSPWYSVIRRAAMYRFFGFCLQEWTAKRRDDGKIGMLDIEPRPQVTIERWDVDDSGSILGAYQRLSKGGEIYLPRNKIIHVVDNALDDTPEGLGLFRHLVRSAERLRAYEELEEVAFETDLRGIPIARAPLAALRDAETSGKLKPEEVTKLLRPFENFLRNHIRNKKTGLMIDSSTYKTEDDAIRPSPIKEWDVELLQGSSTSQEAVAAAIVRVTKEMARTLSVEHLLLGSDGAGSLALGKTKTNDFYMVVQSTLGEIKETYQQDFLQPLGRMNGWDKKLLPHLKTDSVQFKDVEAMSAALRDMATAGAVLMPNDPAINEMRDLLGLSRAPEVDLEELALLTGRPPSTGDTGAGGGGPTKKPGQAGADKPIKRGERGQQTTGKA